MLLIGAVIGWSIRRIVETRRAEGHKSSMSNAKSGPEREACPECGGTMAALGLGVSGLKGCCEACDGEGTVAGDL